MYVCFWEYACMLKDSWERQWECACSVLVSVSWSIKSCKKCSCPSSNEVLTDDEAALETRQSNTSPSPSHYSSFFSCFLSCLSSFFTLHCFSVSYHHSVPVFSSVPFALAILCLIFLFFPFLSCRLEENITTPAVRDVPAVT